MTKLLKTITLFLSLSIAATQAINANTRQLADPESLLAHQGPIPPIVAGYGSWGDYSVAAPESFQLTTQGYTNTVTLYYPLGQSAPAPAIFFAPGWKVPCDAYGQLLQFLVTKGYVAVCDDYVEDSEKIGAQLNDSFSEAVNRYPNRIDTGKFGLSGHSSGAGLLPSLSYDFVRSKGWGGLDGQNAFIFSSAPWFDFDITDAMLLNYPTGIKLIMHTYEDDMTTDLRTYIDQFESLPIPDAEKEYITLRSTTIAGYTYQADHRVITTDDNGYGVFDAMDDYGVFRLIDALADYTFNDNEAGKNIALGDGSDEQLEIGDLRDLISTDDPRPIPGATYDYPCDVDYNPRRTYCVDHDGELPASVLISPTKNVTILDDIPIFRWESSPTATDYFLQIRPMSSSGEPDWTVSFGENMTAAAANCDGSTQECTYILNGNLPSDQYVWWVLPRNTTEDGVWSRRGYFEKVLTPFTSYLPLVVSE